VGSSANVSALMTQNCRDIAVSFRDAYTNENVCDHKNIVTTQVPKTTIGGLHYAGTTWDVGDTVTKPGI